jgi:hypothetical protein
LRLQVIADNGEIHRVVAHPSAPACGKAPLSQLRVLVVFCRIPLIDNW